MENEQHSRGKRGLRKILPSEFEGLLFMLFVSTSLQVLAQLPTITSFSPPIGPVGTAVTITGTNFNPTPANNIVFFGATRATVLGGTPSVLGVTVPAGASYQPISVLANSLQAYSRSPFLVTFGTDGTPLSAATFSKVDFATGVQPSAVATGDVDGDGKVDLAVANYTSNTISVFRNTSTGSGVISYATKVDLTTGVGPYSVSMGDLDGDGKLDLTVANSGSNTVSVYLNMASSPGSVSYSTKTDFSVGTLPKSVCIGDLDGDGKPDVTVANYSSNSVSVLRNISTGPGSINYSLANVLSTSQNPSSVSIGDLDGDGKLDLAVTNYGAGTASLYRNTGSPGTFSFQVPVNFSTGSFPPVSVSIGDLDSDGKPDLAVALSNVSSSNISVLRNTSTSGTLNAGSFAAFTSFSTSGTNQTSIGIGDLDGNGKPDLAVTNNSSNTVAVLRNVSTTGTINFTGTFTMTIGSNPLAVAIGDWDSDGKVDLVVTNSGSNTASVIRNTIKSPPTISSFSPVSGPVATTVTITGTGFGSTPASNIVYFGAAQATVSTATSTSLQVSVPAGATYEPISVLEPNGLLAYTKAPFLTTFVGDGTGLDINSYAARIDFTPGTNPYSLSIGDLDRDGKADLAVVNYASNTLSIFRNTSSGAGSISYAGKVDFTTGTSPTSVSLGDMDGDGKQDLSVANFLDNTVSVFRNTSTGPGSISLATKVDFATGIAPNSVSTRDFDGDGRADLAVSNNSGTVSVFRNTSTGVGSINYAVKADFAIPAPVAITVGDANGDGRADLVVGTSSTNIVAVFQNQTGGAGSISFSPHSDFPTLAPLRAVSMGDLNNDGKQDLAVLTTANLVQLFRSASGPAFVSDSPPLATGTTPLSVSIGDLDGDGKADLAVANGGSNTLSVFLNTSPVGGPITFSPKVDFNTATSPQSVAIGDLDSDGKSDVAVAASSVSVFRRQILPPAPVANAASSIGQLAFTANWAASPGANGYYLDVSTSNTFIPLVTGYDNLFVGNVTTYNVSTSLAAGTDYFFRVRAADVTPVSSNSNTITLTTLPPDPVLLSPTAITQTSFSASWNGAASATGYQLEVTTDPGFAIQISGSPFSVGNFLTKVITGLTPGTNYYYRVSAVNASGTSGNSGVQTVTTVPPNPVSFPPNLITQTSFNANWDKAPFNYVLEVTTDVNFTNHIPQSPFSVSYYIYNQSVTGLMAGTYYYYRVRAVNSSGSSEFSDPQIVLTTPPDATSSGATAVGQTSFTANWVAASSASSYQLDVSTDVSFLTFASGYDNLSVSGISQNVTGLDPGTAYYYRVRAVNASGSSPSSNTISQMTIPSDPVASAATSITQFSFQANWAVATGATNYFVDIATDAGFASILPSYNNSSVATNQLLVTGLAPATTYYYRIRAFDEGGTSGNSGAASALTIPATPSTNLASSISQTGFTANWNVVTGISNYFIDIASDAGFNSILPSYSNLSVATNLLSVAGLTAGTTYYYRVRSANTSGSSPSSTTISQITVSPDPVSSAASSINQTSFQANWAAATGASGYYLDVASDVGFTTILPSYNNLTVATPTKSITNLSSGTTYYFRIRSYNSAGTSSNSSTMSALTIPATPVASAATSVSQTGFTANWNTITGTSNYFIDIATDAGFNSILPSYNNLSIATSLLSVTGLTAGTTYYYRVRSADATGISPSSSTISQITVPPNQVASPASLITQTSFQANWAATTGAASYFLDVATDAGFSAILPSYSNFSILPTSVSVTGLAGGTTYYYRVRATNAAGTSGNSGTISTLTLPAPPTANAASSVTQNSFSANWTGVTGAASYSIDVATDNSFVTIIYNAINVGSLTNYPAASLSSSTSYFYRVRAINGTGSSAVSNTISVTTNASSTSSALAVTTTTASPTSITSGFAQILLAGRVTGGVGTPTVSLKYRSITSNTFASTAPTDKGSGNFEASVAEAKFDELGLEYYFEATDQASTTVKSTNAFVYMSKTAVSIDAIPFSSGFDGSSKTYEMFSIPYSLADKTIQSVFVTLGGADKTKWRLLHYQGGHYIEYPENIATIDVGKGYWFNTQQKVEIKPGAGDVKQANQTTPATVSFEKGWNQIGNPFPFNVSWDAIKTANPSAGLNSLWLFENGNYIKKDVLAKWKGAFVFSDNGGTVNFPVLAKTSAPGRVEKNTFSVDLDTEAWQVPIILNLNGSEQVSAIGMHPEAKNSKDKFDEITIPRFIDYLEMNTFHEEFFSHNFSTDVVPTANMGSWLFTVSSNHKDGKAIITWDQSAIAESASKLALLDLQEGTLVDMKTSSQYSFTWNEGRQFKILYSKEGEILPGVTILGNAYPNPFRGGVTFPVLLEKDQSLVQIQVYDLMGRKVKTISMESVKAGVHIFPWDGQTDSGPVLENGLFLYQLIGDCGILAPAKRMVKQ